ncbi:MAG: hypothetical protein K0S38_1011 [Candidatus Paceibacter sp.]|nr:hypothetical protein [Candidatus Paceibacter sp.]
MKVVYQNLFLQHIHKKTSSDAGLSITSSSLRGVVHVLLPCASLSLQSVKFYSLYLPLIVLPLVNYTLSFKKIQSKWHKTHGSDKATDSIADKIKPSIIDIIRKSQTKIILKEKF